MTKYNFLIGSFQYEGDIQHPDPSRISQIIYTYNVSLLHLLSYQALERVKITTKMECQRIIMDNYLYSTVSETAMSTLMLFYFKFQVVKLFIAEEDLNELMDQKEYITFWELKTLGRILVLGSEKLCKQAEHIFRVPCKNIVPVPAEQNYISIQDC